LTFVTVTFAVVVVGFDVDTAGFGALTFGPPWIASTGVAVNTNARNTANEQRFMTPPFANDPRPTARGVSPDRKVC
jgi:hypothetical protein